MLSGTPIMCVRARQQERLTPMRKLSVSVKGKSEGFPAPDSLCAKRRLVYRSSHFGDRFSINAPMPSSASRNIMFSTITSEQY